MEFYQGYASDSWLLNTEITGLFVARKDLDIAGVVCWRSGLLFSQARRLGWIPQLCGWPSWSEVHMEERQKQNLLTYTLFSIRMVASRLTDVFCYHSCVSEIFLIENGKRTHTSLVHIDKHCRQTCLLCRTFSSECSMHKLKPCFAILLGAVSGAEINYSSFNWVKSHLQNVGKFKNTMETLKKGLNCA